MRSEQAARALAQENGGAFTTRMAAERGITARQLYWLSHVTGALARLGHGVYLLNDSDMPFADIAAAVHLIAERTASVTAASHETALAVLRLSDAMPSAIHVTSDRPAAYRGRPVPDVRHHFAPLPDQDRTSWSGVPVTTAERTIIDVASEGDIDLARQAARQALEDARTTRHRLALQISRRFDRRGDRDRVARQLAVHGLITDVRVLQ